MSEDVAEIKGWILLAKDEDAVSWHVAWIDVFGTKKAALKFAAENNWHKPFRAVRGELRATP